MKKSKVRADITCLVTEEQQEVDRISSQTGDHQQQNTEKNTKKVEEKKRTNTSSNDCSVSDTRDALLKAFVK